MWPTLQRGVAAGTVVGLLYGLFTAAVAHPLTTALERTVQHSHAGEHADSHGHAVSETTTALVSVGGGVCWGIFLGALFGLGYYLFEPAIPGPAAVRPYVLAGAGFLTVSVTPWLVLPPAAPGMEHQLPTSTRVPLYAGLIVAGAVVSCLAVAAARRASNPRRGAVAGFAPVVATVVVVPLVTPATVTAGDLSTEFVLAYRSLVVLGQAGLWFGLAAGYRWLDTPAEDALGSPTYETQI